MDPTPQAAEELVKIAWQEGIYLKTGEVVMMADTAPEGLVAKREGQSRSVSSRESDDAFTMLADKPAYFVPEAAEAVHDMVWYATEQVREKLPWSQGQQGVAERSRLTLSKSDDGVLVGEPNGKPVILFTPYESWKGARDAGDRAGVQRVLAVVLGDGSATMNVGEFESRGVLVTKHNDAAFLARQIIEARRELGLPFSS